MRFHYFPDREEVWGNRHLLKGSRLVLREDFPEEMEHKRRTLLPYYKVAKEKKMKASMKGDTIRVEGKTYTTSEISKLDEHVAPRDVCERFIKEQNLLLYYGALSPFSNLHPTEIQIEGCKFTSSEQYYMYKKAKFANDLEKAHKILNARDGREAKYHGSKIEVNQEKWMEERAAKTMKFAVKEKFRQNPILYQALAATKGCALVECNPYDSVWGAGVALKSPEAENRQTFKGRNLMGKILGEVRQELSQES